MILKSLSVQAISVLIHRVNILPENDVVVDVVTQISHSGRVKLGIRRNSGQRRLQPTTVTVSG